MRHRELKRKLEVIKDFDPADLVKNDTRQNGTLTLKDDELIRKAPNGNFIMFKSNFDFLEKPSGYIDSQEFFNDRDIEESKRSEARLLFPD